MSTAGCNTGEISAIWEWFSENKWAMFSIFVIVGSTMCILGRQFLKPVLFITGCLEASFLLMLISYSTFAHESSQIWVGWVILVVSVAIGVGVGFVFIRF